MSAGLNMQYPANSRQSPQIQINHSKSTTDYGCYLRETANNEYGTTIK